MDVATKNNEYNLEKIHRTGSNPVLTTRVELCSTNVLPHNEKWYHNHRDLSRLLESKSVGWCTSNKK